MELYMFQADVTSWSC